MAVRLVTCAAIAGLGLAACSNPLDDIGRMSDMSIPEDAAAAALVETPDAAGTGFFAWLFGSAANDAEVTGAAALGPIDPETGEPVTEPGGTDVIPGDDTMDDALREEAEQPRGGIFGFFRDNLGRSPGAADPAPSGPDGEVIPPGLQLAYGEIGTVCGLSARDLGTVVERQAGFTLHDSAAGSRDLRNFYVTGFRDGCARQFTGAMVLFGDPGMHETIRYSAGTSGIPYNRTDEAYEEIKAGICRAARGEPCGEAIDRLSRSMAFLTVYSRFGSSPQWAEILLYDNEVVAMDMKSI